MHKFYSKPDTINTGFGIIPRMYQHDGHPLVFSHVDIRNPKLPVAVYRHPTKPFTASPKRLQVFSIKQVRVD